MHGFVDLRTSSSAMNVLAFSTESQINHRHSFRHMLLVALLIVSSFRSPAMADFGFHFRKTPDSCYQCGGGGGAGSQAYSSQQIIRWRSWKINQQAIDLDRAGRYTEALAKFREAMETDPTNSVVAGNYYSTKARLEFNDDLEQSLRDAERAASLEPTAAMFEWLRRFKIQAEIFRRARATSAARVRAYNLVQQKDYRDAIVILKALIQENKKDFWAHNELASAYEFWAYQDLMSALDRSMHGKSNDLSHYKRLIDSFAAELHALHKINPDGYTMIGLLLDLKDRVINKLDDAVTYAHPDDASKRTLVRDVVDHTRDLIKSIDPQDYNLGNYDLSHDLANLMKRLRYNLKDSAVFEQLRNVNENSARAVASKDEEAKWLSSCGFDTTGPGCSTAPPLSQFVRSRSSDPRGAVAALVNSIPQQAWTGNDPRLRQNIAWFSVLEEQRAFATRQYRSADSKERRHEGNPKIETLLKDNAMDQANWIDSDERTARTEIKSALKNDGLSWGEETPQTRETPSGTPLSQREIDGLRRRFGK